MPQPALEPKLTSTEWDKEQTPNVAPKPPLPQNNNTGNSVVLSPFQQAGGGDEAGTGGGTGQFLGLPPEGVCLVHYLQHVALPEAHAGVGTGDGRVLLRAVVGHGPHVQLHHHGTEENNRLTFHLGSKSIDIKQ